MDRLLLIVLAVGFIVWIAWDIIEFTSIQERLHQIEKDSIERDSRILQTFGGEVHVMEEESADE